MLHSCSVMLKDVYDSKRINHHLYSDPTSNLSSNNLNNELEFPVRAIIVSNQFWPNFKDNFNVELPSVIQKHLDNYTKAFESFKVCKIEIYYYHNLIYGEVILLKIFITIIILFKILFIG